MSQKEVELTLTIEPIAPDTISDIETLIHNAVLEASDISDFLESEPDISLERRAPIPPNVIEVVAAIKLAFKDIPEAISGIANFLNALRERLLRAHVIRVTADIDGQRIAIKGSTESEWKIELGAGFIMAYKPREEKKTKKKRKRAK